MSQKTNIIKNQHNGTGTIDIFLTISGLCKKKPLSTLIEKYIIEKVREKRLQSGLSQLALSQRLELTDTFVSHVEAASKRAKYNVNHLNELAKIFDCSPRDFLPDRPL